MKMTEDELVNATEAILEAGLNGTLVSGYFGSRFDCNPEQGCALGQAARGNNAYNRTRWVIDRFSIVERDDLFQTNDDMVDADIPLEIVAETTAALITEVVRP